MVGTQVRGESGPGQGLLVQQLSAKVFLADGGLADQAALIPVFHRWIREARLGEDRLLVDVADYKHVANGPGVMLIANHGHYGMDEGVGGRVGMLFTRKRDPLGPAGPKLLEAVGEAAEAARLLEEEAGLRFDGGALLVRVTSRLAAENTAAGFEALMPSVQALAARLWGDADVALERESEDARAPLGVWVTASAPRAIAEWGARLR